MALPNINAKGASTAGHIAYVKVFDEYADYQWLLVGFHFFLCSLRHNELAALGGIVGQSIVCSD